VNGTLDTTFGSSGSGLIQEDFAGADTSLAVIQPDGELVLYGAAMEGDYIRVARYLP
jgi:hypothetical protein